MSVQLLKEHNSFSGLTSFYEHDSISTKTKMRFSVYHPDTSKRSKRCLIWLSGLTCNEENFITKAGAQSLLSGGDIMVICPDTSPRGLSLENEHESWDFGSGASFYLNATSAGYRDHYQMESYVVSELVELARSEFGVDQFAISGHSMGGHGALTLGLKYPKLFESISAFSPIVNPVNCPWGQKAFSGYLGEDRAQWLKHDATELINAGHLHNRKILIDQGTADEFLERELLTDNFVKACAKANQSLDIKLRSGFDHSYYFISSFLREHFEFHAHNLAF